MTFADYTTKTGRDWRAGATLVGDIATSLEKYFNVLAAVKWDATGRSEYTVDSKDNNNFCAYSLGQDSCTSGIYKFTPQNHTEVAFRAKVDAVKSDLATWANLGASTTTAAQFDGGGVFLNLRTENSDNSEDTSFGFSNAFSPWCRTYFFTGDNSVVNKYPPFVREQTTNFKSFRYIFSGSGFPLDRSLDATYSALAPEVDIATVEALTTALAYTVTGTLDDIQPDGTTTGDTVLKVGSIRSFSLYDRTPAHEYTGGLA
jgi:hypothetical protein